ncbi:hypothetical protein [Rhizosphaericola mali]|uniref:SseB family protein n=1 Tax=Rhizosphaericola mali TaxID=2545455 RepID=A0A5P2G843_9BACT|nr:hypothetical protein [Rhizosphaericola mali]QES87691.1 hypothetical protein E0W69_003095 [Rhizosphaericola mali]
MGIFNLFKKKDSEKPEEAKAEFTKDNIQEEKISAPAPAAPAPQPIATEQPNNAVSPEPTPASENNGEIPTYYGDLHKTGLLMDLCETPIEKRDENWAKEFLENLPKASFKSGEPQVITGPDGFPYFQLSFPEPCVEFQCFVVDNMVYDFLLSNGMGFVINPQKEQPDWVFSYGDVFNYALKKDFYNTDNTFFSKETPQDEKIAEDVQVMVGSPSEFILPVPVRAVIKNFLQFKGIKEPKVLLMSKEKDGVQVQDLVFNFTPKNFEKEEEFRATAQQLMWFLPRHYSVIFYDENESLKGHFENL